MGEVALVVGALEVGGLASCRWRATIDPPDRPCDRFLVCPPRPPRTRQPWMQPAQLRMPRVATVNR